MSSMSPVIEAAFLNQTEDALRELCQAALNCGMEKMQLAMMLRKVADDLIPPLIVPAVETMQ